MTARRRGSWKNSDRFSVSEAAKGVVSLRVVKKIRYFAKYWKYES